MVDIVSVSQIPELRQYVVALALFYEKALIKKVCRSSHTIILDNQAGDCYNIITNGENQRQLIKFSLVLFLHLLS